MNGTTSAMSFRRAKPVTSKTSPEGDHDEIRKISGVKPWINGSYLVSSGNRKLDDLVGGGQGLGTIMMIESDCFSNYGESILSYGVAQALSSGHKVLVITDSSQSPESLVSMLPYNQNVGKSIANSFPKKISNHDEIVSGQIGPVTTSNSDNDRSTVPVILSRPDEFGLKIAWQYEKYVVEGTSSIGRIVCKSIINYLKLIAGT